MANAPPDPRRPTAAQIPGQQLLYPARQSDLHPAPVSDFVDYRPAGKLAGKRGREPRFARLDTAERIGPPRRHAFGALRDLTAGHPLIPAL